MLETLKAVHLELVARDDQLTDRWKDAQQQLELAKHMETLTRSAMQENSEMVETLERFIRSLEAEGVK